MEALRIEIVNPKAKRILKDLADMNLINITESEGSKNEFRKLLRKLRLNANTAPSLVEITEEIEEVRAERYANKEK